MRDQLKAARLAALAAGHLARRFKRRLHPATSGQIATAAFELAGWIRPLRPSTGKSLGFRPTIGPDRCEPTNHTSPPWNLEAVRSRPMHPAGAAFDPLAFATTIGPNRSSTDHRARDSGNSRRPLQTQRGIALAFVSLAMGP